MATLLCSGLRCIHGAAPVLHKVLLDSPVNTENERFETIYKIICMNLKITMLNKRRRNKRVYAILIHLYKVQ